MEAALPRKIVFSSTAGSREDEQQIAASIDLPDAPI